MLGVLTLEDVLEELVGDIDDEFDARKQYHQAKEERRRRRYADRAASGRWDNLPPPTDTSKKTIAYTTPMHTKRIASGGWLLQAPPPASHFGDS